MIILRRHDVILLLAIIMMIVAGCVTKPSDGGDSISSGAAISTDKAIALYQANCLACHASDLRGKVGPNLREVGDRLQKSQIAEQIHEGGKGMPSFESRLNEKEIDTLAKWLESHKKE
ncbi:c-type cytochrome [Paenibacillus sp. GCM10027629]